MTRDISPFMDASMSSQAAIIPSTTKGSKQLRACLLCSLIQHPLDFRKYGCPNCEELMQVCLPTDYSRPSNLHSFVQMKNSGDRVTACTTTYYDGVIAVIDPEKSWVAKWQRTCAFYAPPINPHSFS